MLYVVPLCGRWAAQASGLGTEAMAVIIPWMGIINLLNPIVNFFLYCMRHKDLKLAVKCLFYCKKITKAMLDRLGVEQTTAHKPKQSDPNQSDNVEVNSV